MLGIVLLLVLAAPAIGLFWTFLADEDPAALQVGALYALYMSLFWIAFRIVRQRFKPLPAIRAAGLPHAPITHLVGISLVSVLVVLIGFDGLGVLAGTIDKEQMRSTHGLAGPLLAILTKYLQPAFFAYAAFRYRAMGSRQARSSLWLIGLCTLVSGAALGGKASGLIAILPGLIALYWWGVSVTRFAFFTLLVLLFLVGAAWLFDRDLIEAEGSSDLLSYLVYRAFVLSSEGALYVGSSLLNGQLDMRYAPTLLEWFGKSVVVRLIDDPANLHLYGFSTAVTANIYPDLIDRINSGEWNITPTAFVEFLVMGGLWAPLAGGLACGAIAAALMNRVDANLRDGATRSAALITSYIVLVYLGWISSGGIANLVHPIVLLGLGLAYLMLPSRRMRPSPALPVALVGSST